MTLVPLRQVEIGSSRSCDEMLQSVLDPEQKPGNKKNGFMALENNARGGGK